MSRVGLRGFAVLVCCLCSPWAACHDEDNAPFIPSEMYGLWRSEGYNKVVHVHGTARSSGSAEPGHITVYNVTGNSSVLEWRGTHKDYLLNQVGDGDSPALVSKVGPNRMFIESRSLPGYKYFYNRIERLPGPYRHFGRGESPEDRDALHNFEIYWNVLAENYAYFGLRGMDWKLTGDKWRKIIGQSASDLVLKRAFSSIVQDLDDLHTMVFGDPIYRAGSKPLMSVAAWMRTRKRLDSEVQSHGFWQDRADFRNALSERVRSKILNGKFSVGANGKLIWGRLTNGVGYIASVGFSGFLEGEEAPLGAQLREFSDSLDKAMQDMRGTPSVIVDLRMNGGGYDAAALQLVSRFVDQPRLAFTKKARLNDGFTDPQPIFVRPLNSAVSYLNPTYVLTSDVTASAAEVAVLAFKVLPHVVLAGGKTAGVLSDAQSARLPNGMRVSFSNEVYTSVDGRSYEGLGVPPDLVVPYEKSSDFYKGFDDILEVASDDRVRAAYTGKH